MSSPSDIAAHNRLRAHPVLFALIGVCHTLLTAGIVFGWASLLAVFVRGEGLDLSPTQFALIFTHGAIGNYLSTLPFGLLLDNYGPKTTGILASLMFACGLILCSNATTSTACLDLGFALIGFSGPAIQLPTLHLARLFSGNAREGGSGGAALVMSAQAGAFDGGTMVFAIFSALHGATGLTSQTFFRLYTVVPFFTLLTALFYWPNTILPDEDNYGESDDRGTIKTPASYVGRSPYLSPAAMLKENTGDTKKRLVDAPLATILTQPPFYCLAFWVAVHILKLNFVVATINNQLDYAMADSDTNLTNTLISIFGAMLPFGFVVLPLVAYLLGSSTLICFQLANVVGVLYGAVLTFTPGVASFQILVVFSSVATSRQLVYSTVFHQTGEIFGFRNYGVILGLINIIVSGVSLVQGPLVAWAERAEDYTGANAVLLLATLPLFGIVYWVVPPSPLKKDRARSKMAPDNEETALLSQGSTGLSSSHRLSFGRVMT